MLRDSGRIEECSNIILLLYWKNKMVGEDDIRVGNEEPEKLKIRVGKNRDGATGKFYLDFYPEFCRIRDQEREESDYNDR